MFPFNARARRKIHASAIRKRFTEKKNTFGSLFSSPTTGRTTPHETNHDDDDDDENVDGHDGRSLTRKGNEKAESQVNLFQFP